MKLHISSRFTKRIENLSLQQLKEELDKMKTDLEGYARTYRIMCIIENTYEARPLRKIFFWIARKYHYGVLDMHYDLYQHAYYVMMEKAKTEMLEKHPGITVLIQQGRVKDFDDFINNYLKAAYPDK